MLENQIEIVCKRCRNEMIGVKTREKIYKKEGGGTCKDCLKKQSSDILKKIRSVQSKEEASFWAKYARSKVTSESLSNGVKKQWETFRSDPKKYKEICYARSKRMEKVWKNYSDEQKNFIVKSLCDSNNCGRSKVSDELKQSLINNGLYNGFESEQIFHGFVPDEINHDLKIIIEVFGDLYHCNPRKYKNPNVFVNAIKRTVGEQWKRDRIKLACYYKHGYTVIVVWESDIRKKLNEQLERIKNEIDKKRNIA